VNKQGELNELALFAGAGGGILGGHLLGWRTVCAVEWEPYPASILCARQNDGIFPPFPIWDDVQTFDGKPWRGIVDVVSGGFPCQDISAAGKGAGIEGQRSGMWSHMARIIREVDPAFTFIENSPMLRTRGLGTVLNDLNSMGFDAKWGCIPASAVGANHKRDRIWIVGKSKRKGLEGHRIQPGQQEVPQPRNTSTLANTNDARLEWREQQSKGSNGERQLAHTEDQGDVWRQWQLGFAEQENDSGGGQIDGRREWWQAEPNVGRVADGVAARVDRLKAIGNGQVPLCAATAWRLLNAA
jgi:DNA (cytosine-5)-methyltransferase 1